MRTYLLITLFYSGVTLAKHLEIWNLLYFRDSSSCFFSGRPERKTESVNQKSWMEYHGDRYLPYSRNRAEKVPLPSCSSVLFQGKMPGELFAISNTAAHISLLPKPGKKRVWKTIVDYKEQKLGLTDPRMVFNSQDQVIAWVGYKDIMSGYTSNNLIIIDLKLKFRSPMIKVGMGREGMAGVALVPEKKEILIASMDWCAQVKSYNYKGELVREFPGINAWMKENDLCLGMNHVWEWKIDLGKDLTTGQYLFHFSSSDLERSPGPREGEIYRLNLDADTVER